MSEVGMDAEDARTVPDRVYMVAGDAERSVTIRHDGTIEEHMTRRVHVHHVAPVAPMEPFEQDYGDD